VKLSYTHKQAAKILAQQQHASLHVCKITWIALARSPQNPQEKQPMTWRPEFSSFRSHKM